MNQALTMGFILGKAFFPRRISVNGVYGVVTGRRTLENRRRMEFLSS